MPIREPSRVEAVCLQTAEVRSAASKRPIRNPLKGSILTIITSHMKILSFEKGDEEVQKAGQKGKQGNKFTNL